LALVSFVVPAMAKKLKKLSAANERAQPSKKEMPPKGHRADYFHPK
jgi:hypothetical protein